MAKLCICAHGQHGKDTLADMLSVFGYTKADSSRTALEEFLYDKLSPKYGYKTIDEAYEDRVNHRAEWFNEIVDYNTPDKTRLAKVVMGKADIYVGMRCPEELKACKEAGLFDHVIWVDASKRVPPEGIDSCKVTADMADIVVCNNGALEDLQMRAELLTTVL